MSSKSVKVSVPATVSNVGCGFDVMGFAIDLVCDEITLTINNKIDCLNITRITGDDGRLPRDARANTCTQAMQSMLDELNLLIGIDIKISKKIGFGSGLGSSAASAVAGVYALNELLGKPLTVDQLLRHAMEGEHVASKSYHADNVAPCLYGGFVLIRSYNPIDIIKLEPAADLYCTIIHPDIEIKTSEARKLLGKTLPLKKAISQWGNVGALVAAIMSNNMDLLGRAIHDEVAEPKRSALIPGYYDIKNAALTAGAKGCNISGSGPAIFAFSDSEEKAAFIGKEMKKAAGRHGLKSKLYISKVNKFGPKVID